MYVAECQCLAHRQPCAKTSTAKSAGKVNHYCQLGSRCLRTRFRASVQGLGVMVRSDEASLYFRLYATKYPSR